MENKEANVSADDVNKTWMDFYTVTHEKPSGGHQNTRYNTNTNNWYCRYSTEAIVVIWQRPLDVSCCMSCTYKALYKLIRNNGNFKGTNRHGASLTLKTLNVYGIK